MKSISLTKILAMIAAGTVLCSSAFAQTSPPDASVDANGNLVLGDGTVINPPAGDVVNGDLVIDGQTIAAPNATVLGDGSLDLGNGTVLTVPSLPVSLFFSNLFQYTDPSQAGWYYSDIINHFWNGASVGIDGWIFWEDWGVQNQDNGWFFINTASGTEEGFWAYSNFLASWCYFWVGGEGFSRISSGTDFQTGWFYVQNPPSGSNWYFYDQYNADWAGGARVCLITNDNGANWIRLR